MDRDELQRQLIELFAYRDQDDNMIVSPGTRWQARRVMDLIREAGWRSPAEVAALIKPWEDEARASRGVRAGCTI